MIFSLDIIASLQCNSASFRETSTKAAIPDLMGLRQPKQRRWKRRNLNLVWHKTNSLNYAALAISWHTRFWMLSFVGIKQAFLRHDSRPYTCPLDVLRQSIRSQTYARTGNMVSNLEMVDQGTYVCHLCFGKAPVTMLASTCTTKDAIPDLMRLRQPKQRRWKRRNLNLVWHKTNSLNYAALAISWHTRLWMLSFVRIKQAFLRHDSQPYACPLDLLR